MKCKIVRRNSIMFSTLVISMMFIIMSLGTAVSDAEPSCPQWHNQNDMVDDGYLMISKVETISNLDVTIPDAEIEGTSLFYYAAAVTARDGNYSINTTSTSGGKVNLSAGDTFEKAKSLFEKFQYVALYIGDFNEHYYMMILTYTPVIEYDVSGSISTSGEISATATKTANATGDLSNPLFYVIAHYSDGKFISMYVPVTAAADGSLTLSNMGVSTISLVDVMVGVVGAVPSDEPTVYYGEAVLKATA